VQKVGWRARTRLVIDVLMCSKREGDPKWWSTVRITALGNWEKPVPNRSRCITSSRRKCGGKDDDEGGVHWLSSGQSCGEQVAVKVVGVGYRDMSY
jgi:hypothetical protein